MQNVHCFNRGCLLEYFDMTDKVSSFYLFAVAKIEFGAESGYNNRRNQTPPFNGLFSCGFQLHGDEDMGTELAAEGALDVAGDDGAVVDGGGAVHAHRDVEHARVA